MKGVKLATAALILAALASNTIPQSLAQENSDGAEPDPLKVAKVEGADKSSIVQRARATEGEAVQVEAAEPPVGQVAQQVAPSPAQQAPTGTVVTPPSTVAQPTSQAIDKLSTAGPKEVNSNNQEASEPPTSDQKNKSANKDGQTPSVPTRDSETGSRVTGSRVASGSSGNSGNSNGANNNKGQPEKAKGETAGAFSTAVGVTTKTLLTFCLVLSATVLLV